MGHVEIAQLSADNERLREALVGLEKAGSEVSRLGTVTGGQWPKLTMALLFARAALQRKVGV